MRRLKIKRESWPIEGTFTIARGSKTEADVLVVEIEQDNHVGRGECVPYKRYGESLDKTTAEIQSVQKAIEQGMSREDLQSELPASAARNAIDCALWDLEAKLAGTTVATLANLPAIDEEVTTAFTISLDTPEIMQRKAGENKHRPLLKLKLTGQGDLERCEAVRRGAPKSSLIVDANEGWDAETYTILAPKLAAMGVEGIEQPLPQGHDDILSSLPHPVPLIADESCHDRGSLAALKGRYEVVNIKLDKAGGLTEAIALKREAEAMGFEIMIGCMLATSLAMAPALLLTRNARFVDLDGPLLLKKDRPNGLVFKESTIVTSSTTLWGLAPD